MQAAVRPPGGATLRSLREADVAGAPPPNERYSRYTVSLEPSQLDGMAVAVEEDVIRVAVTFCEVASIVRSDRRPDDDRAGTTVASRVVEMQGRVALERTLSIAAKRKDEVAGLQVLDSQILASMPWKLVRWYHHIVGIDVVIGS